MAAADQATEAQRSGLRMTQPEPNASSRDTEPARQTDAGTANIPTLPAETGGRTGPDPVRYGDWEKNGRCIDF
ncbi:MAG: DUF1674 domain-containing protein [Rudaea sp.]